VWLAQVHGADVVTASAPGQSAGASADAVVTTEPGVPVAVHTADCAPLLLVADHGVGVVHAGWRGLLAGVVEATVEAMHAVGTPPHGAVLGPVIRPRCYEFGEADLAPMVERFGAAVRATTAWGTTALDLPVAVRSAVGEHGIALDDVGTCTACSPAHWSHRARGDRGRQALVAWLVP
jgi:YfiH family protein